MARPKKRPSGDAVDDPEVVVTEPVAAGIDAPVDSAELPPDHVWADLLNEHGVRIKRVAVKTSDAGFQMHHNGVMWRHVSTGPDGVWGYMV